MMRYIHLYFTYMKRSLISRMEYKKDTIVAIMGFFLENAASILSIYFILSSIPTLNDGVNNWTFAQVGFLYGFVMLPRGLDHLLTDELWLVAYRRVKSGDMDSYFLKPLPVLFQVIAEKFQADAFGELIVGVVMMVVCGIISNITITFEGVLLLIVATIFGAMIITALKIILSSLAFVFKTTGPLLQIVYNFMDFVKYPVTIFPKVIVNMLIFAIPFGLCISLPVDLIYFNTFGINPYLLMLWIILTAVILLALSIVIWSVCERRYESTGS